MRRICLVFLLSLCLLSCESGTTDNGDTLSTLDAPKGLSESYILIIDTFQFVAAENGVAPGFNLDGVISGDDDEATCRKEDLLSPDGEEGIDNQLAKVVPLFDVIGVGGALDYTQNSIEEGGVLIMLEISGVDDDLNDDDVRIEIKAGFGVPLLGTDGRILANQTFHMHPESPDSAIPGAFIEDGVLHAGPFVAKIPFAILGMNYELTFHGGFIRAEWSSGGWLGDGLLGGGVTLEDLYGIGETAAADDGSVLPAIKTLFSGMADLVPNEEGECQQVSSAIAFSAIPAFYFPGEN
jgi:hypothetical protein